MRIYIFKSETRKGLQAFAGDLVGSRLPQNHGPWTATGIGPDNGAPHNFSRDAIEEAIDAEGFQLWRFVEKTAFHNVSFGEWRQSPECTFATAYRCPLSGNPDIEPTWPQGRVWLRAVFGSIHSACLSALDAMGRAAR